MSTNRSSARNSASSSGRRVRPARNSRPTMQETHKRALIARVDRSGGSFRELTTWLNSRFNTRYSVFQISAYLGNNGYREVYTQ